MATQQDVIGFFNSVPHDRILALTYTLDSEDVARRYARFIRPCIQCFRCWQTLEPAAARQYAPTHVPCAQNNKNTWKHAQTNTELNSELNLPGMNVRFSWSVIEAHCDVGASFRAKHVSTLVRTGRCLLMVVMPVCPPCDQKPKVQAVTVASSLLITGRCLVCGGSWLCLISRYGFPPSCHSRSDSRKNRSWEVWQTIYDLQANSLLFVRHE